MGIKCRSWIRTGDACHENIDPFDVQNIFNFYVLRLLSNRFYLYNYDKFGIKITRNSTGIWKIASLVDMFESTLTMIAHVTPYSEP